MRVCMCVCMSETQYVCRANTAGEGVQVSNPESLVLKIPPAPGYNFLKAFPHCGIQETAFLMELKVSAWLQETNPHTEPLLVNTLSHHWEKGQLIFHRLCFPSFSIQIHVLLLEPPSFH